ncbi:hypothetical protein GWK47_053904 [Chionoecetes opilio]|uniref:Uncharacterized protein n=1 Tax=Chionoecetes opilio TaxID=41210 RepID=A0A8J4Y6J8_CHIOP|nr:hypothetical protein GWK47_053904 [Chionoecetes opilio]
MECVYICSTADRLGLSDNQVTALVSATLRLVGADLAIVISNLNNETEQDADKVPHHSVVHGSILARALQYAASPLGWQDAENVAGKWILGPRQRLWLCLSQDHLHILKASYW